jgi:transcriptional regulator with XRE-family HTH domain
MKLGDRLIQLRKEKHYTRDEFAQLLGISKYTLRNYELGVTEPGHPFLIKIAGLFDTSIDYILGLTEEREKMHSYELKTSEFEHIQKYRSLDDPGRDHVNSVLDWEVERSSQLRQSQELITELKGQNATIIKLPPHSSAYTRLAKYYRSASAGSGVFILGNESTEKISVPATPENEIVDYVIRVSGNSMEPDYHDGDNVMVSQRLEMQHGDVGIFVVNGNAYIKEYGETELISRNPDSPNIKIAEYDNIVCMGKVIGRLEGQYEIINN